MEKNFSYDDNKKYHVKRKLMLIYTNLSTRPHASCDFIIPSTPMSPKLSLTHVLWFKCFPQFLPIP